MLHVIDRNSKPFGYKSVLCGMTKDDVLERQERITAFPESVFPESALHVLHGGDKCEECFNHPETHLRILGNTEL